MKKLVFSFALLLSAAALFGQQEHQYTQFMYNKLLLNPAYAGARGVPSVTAIYRNQWIGFKGSPQSALASFNSPFLSPRVGIGVTLSHQSIGLQRDLHMSLAYSYDLVASDEFSMRVGITASLRSLGIAFSDAQPNVGGDPSLGDEKINDFYGNVGAGLYGTVSDRMYFGFSVPRIYSNAIGYVNGSATLIAKEYQHYYAMAGGIIPIADDINLMPAILLKYVKNAPFDADINVNLDIRKKFTAGLSYRLGGDGPGESIDLLAFWQATPQFGVGASYDFGLSSLKDYNAGSIELMVQADLKKRSKKMSNPRFFL
ncbi:MAG TPA: type IX secretion system membrane protein PorP/SprF [Saprospiraceae bacterium]|nr:type IX secretion system membrane protein PorP/SprF [Saprospiraceae bacterium]HPI06152.1 type IX secretion system membrane protein PorP/SprF [Saprospiraceae bacterium]